MALAAAVGNCKELERLSLLNNCLDDTAMEALRKAWREAGKPDYGLELGTQRPFVAPMEIITTPTVPAKGAELLSPSGRPREPTSPVRSPTRRTSDELAALQMAISRISSTLSDVGGAVGTDASPKDGAPTSHSLFGGRASSPTASLPRTGFIN